MSVTPIDKVKVRWEKLDMTQITEPNLGWGKDSKKSTETLASSLAELKEAIGDKEMDIVESNHTHTVTIAEMGGSGWKKSLPLAAEATVTKTVEEVPVGNVSIRGNGSGHNYEVLLDGVPVQNCRAADFHVDCDGIPTVKLELVCVRGVDIDAGAPLTKKETFNVERDSEEDFRELLDVVKKFKESLNGKE